MYVCVSIWQMRMHSTSVWNVISFRETWIQISSVATVWHVQALANLAPNWYNPTDRPGSRDGTWTLSANSPFCPPPSTDRKDPKVENFFKFAGAFSSSLALTPLPARLWSLFDKECWKAGLKAKMDFPIGCWDEKMAKIWWSRIFDIFHLRQWCWRFGVYFWKLE